jgi:hypothetical protein
LKGFEKKIAGTEIKTTLKRIERRTKRIAGTEIKTTLKRIERRTKRIAGTEIKTRRKLSDPLPVLYMVISLRMR